MNETERDEIIADAAAAGITLTVAEVEEYIEASLVLDDGENAAAQVIVDAFLKKLSEPTLQSLLAGTPPPPKNRSDEVRNLGEVHPGLFYEEPWQHFLTRTRLTAVEVDSMDADDLMAYRMPEAERERELAEERVFLEEDCADARSGAVDKCQQFFKDGEGIREFKTRTGLDGDQILKMSKQELAVANIEIEGA